MLGRRRGMSFWILWAVLVMTFAGCSMTQEQRD